MFVHNMSEVECRNTLMHARVARLACTHKNQPYVVPMYFAYDGHYIYAMSTQGQKIDWMRANPLVCLEVDELSGQEEWKSVIVFGRYEELPNLPQFTDARMHALELLQNRAPLWWEPACIRQNHLDTPHSCTPVSYRIHINRMSGHRATPDIPKKNHRAIEAVRKKSWLSGMVDRVKSAAH